MHLSMHAFVAGLQQMFLKIIFTNDEDFFNQLGSFNCQVNLCMHLSQVCNKFFLKIIFTIEEFLSTN